MTIAFGIGQTLGPTAVGAITDAIGSLSYALECLGAAMLAAGRDRGGVSGCERLNVQVPVDRSRSDKSAQLPLNELYPWSSQ